MSDYHEIYIPGPYNSNMLAGFLVKISQLLEEFDEFYDDTKIKHSSIAMVAEGSINGVPVQWQLTVQMDKSKWVNPRGISPL